MIQLENVTFTYNGSEDKGNLKNISLSIRQGEVILLCGESGCGKSTLERTLIRMYDITDGKVTYKGKDITNEKAKNLQWMKDEVQIIFQDPYSALNPFWNVREIINEPLKKAGMGEKEAEERIEYLLNKDVKSRYG